ncbi:MAG: N-acetylglucosamine-6-phosphate deacetylase [Tetragenococcus halophilus]|uniref:N-acetylglucosamine-6-phosphate deacetylase n=1 Tax=Tetragenococcus halophilus TaxID=51669 RepID=A0A3G5FJM4_TETHA|nr:N-acetylglucosamine-6-phosphate deacetylase [Tetragenococcus halophilus]AYW50557.1 N-acetylglucosamine-6-phosphate deacetylase [Tetragenococcus halophilus]MCO8287975.1 N-acetylglucosamine-6-phosphate deacetylase [Tetragenococcus halophilus]MCO8290654.1 N-acetylglucosamine-6-phosphate deacetylase [Tetragenococcus halophilus]MCO8295145.1 N-acetylglucosamine-6-phosphate deacetylase [Tetragenococcus halophilus]MDN6127049.1 N-acetylglucosamine-6-phosphate deacetylase [Tetragenococcus halophilus]
MREFLAADRFFFASHIEDNGYLEIVDGKFGQYYKILPDEKVNVIDQSGKWIAPGLVDTHIHGFKNHDVMDNDAQGMNEISEGLLSCGVTSFLPTTLTSSRKHLKDVAKMLGEVKGSETGAKIQGIYFEGPFFTEEHKGAQNPSYFSDPDIDTFHEWQEASGGIIKKIALAPERDGVEAFVKQVSDEDVVVSLGHSSATFQQASSAVEAGADVFVHAYNGMSGLNHREPGMVGALLTLNEVYAELICDGYHVHPKAAELVIQKMGYNRVSLITDCMMAGGMPDGDYILGEFPVVVKDGTARMKEGNLAGSILKLKEGVKNVVDWNIATPEQAITMGSLVPAISSNIDDSCGKIKKGRAADFIVLNPDMTLNATYLDGQERYHA